MIPDLLALALLGLAAYRCGALLVADEFPFGAFREWLHDDDRCPPTPPPGSTVRPSAVLFGYLWTCMSCMTVWTTIGWWAAWMIWPAGTLIVATPFAVAGLARALAVGRY